ncbi:MAG: cupin domain-containing protein [Candidatus Diapherotrites archaeon]
MAGKWEELKKIIEYSKGGVLSKKLPKTEGKDVTLFCLARGTGISEHTSTKEGFVFVLEGKGTFNLGGKSIPMLPGTFIHMEKNAVHSLKAEKNTSFILLLLSC